MKGLLYTIEKEKHNENKNIKKVEENELSEEEFNVIKNNISNFSDKFLKQINAENTKFEIVRDENINGENLNSLIGYRGETLNALQTLISRIGNKGLEKRHRIIVDIEGYRNKRIKALQDLAVKVSKTVMKNKKSIKLEPMSAFERKIIHDKLQENPKVTTHSVGKEPNRKVVIEIKK